MHERKAPDGSVFANLECDQSKDEWIEEMYIHVDADTLFAFLGFTNMDCGWSSLVKLDLTKRKVIWKFDDLYDDGKYTSFHWIYFQNENEVVFAADSLTSNKINLIVVNHLEGKIFHKD